MNRLLAVNLRLALIVALGLLGCDNDEKPTGPQPAPAGPATFSPPALVSPHPGPGWGLPEPNDIALPGLFPGPSNSAVPRPSLDRTDLERATEVVWGSMLGTEPSDPVVARLLADVPVLMSGIRQIKGRLYLYLGIGRAYFNRHGGEHIYNTLTKRFPTVPFYIEPSDGVQLLSAVATVAAPAAPTNLRVEALTDSSARVRWDAVAAATDYDVNYKKAVGGRWTNQPHPGTGLYNTLYDLKPNTAYRWAVRAENSEGYSAWVFGRFTTLAGEPGPGPNLTVPTITAAPTSVESGEQITIRATIRNDGNARASSQTIVVYRHTAQTDNPRIGGTQVSSGTTGALAPGASVTRTARTTAPTVTTQTTYHYYACVTPATGEIQTDDNCASAQVTVRPKTGGAPVDRLEPFMMGGDNLRAHDDAADNNYVVDTNLFGFSGTLTLGGLTTTDGTKGFVLSGHGAVFRYSGKSGNTLEDYIKDKNDVLLFAGFYERYGYGHLFSQFLGKVMQTPRPRKGPGTLGHFNDFFYADAAFAAYPSAAADDCSLTTWTGDDVHGTYCLDLGKGEQIETVKPLAIRGKHDAVYNVVGSQSPTIGLAAMFTGDISGVVEGNRVTSDAILSLFAEDRGIFYTYDLNGGGESQKGDSGSPIYTVPDRNGNVHIIGILRGAAQVAGEKVTAFSSWDDVMKELDLQPISP